MSLTFQVVYNDCIRFEVVLDHDLIVKGFVENTLYQYSNLSVSQQQSLEYEFNHVKHLLHLYQLAVEEYTDDEEQRHLVQIMLQDLKLLTVYKRAVSDWHCLPLLQHYQITSTQLFICLATSSPCGRVYLDHQGMNNRNEFRCAFQAMMQQSIQQSTNHVHLDYWNGLGFKLTIPVNIATCRSSEEYHSDYRRYDDRRSTSCIVKIIQFILSIELYRKKRSRIMEMYKLLKQNDQATFYGCKSIIPLIYEYL